MLHHWAKPHQNSIWQVYPEYAPSSVFPFFSVVALPADWAVRTTRWIFITKHFLVILADVHLIFRRRCYSHPSPTETWCTDSVRSLTKMTFCFDVLTASCLCYYVYSGFLWVMANVWAYHINSRVLISRRRRRRRRVCKRKNCQKNWCWQWIPFLAHLHPF